MCPPISLAPCSSRTDKIPLRVCVSSSCCSLAETMAALPLPWRLRLGRRRLQNRAGVKRSQTAIEPGVTHQGGKAIHALQMLLAVRETGCVFWLPPAPPLQCGRGWAGNFAAQPRQAIDVSSAIAAGFRNPAMKVRSMRCFRCQSRRMAPVANRPNAPRRHLHDCR